MSRLGAYTWVALVSASVLLTCGMGTASAADACGHLYKLCNISCDQLGPTGVSVCKHRCDRRLIACDRQTPSSFTQNDRLFGVDSRPK
jgi:hypothetical protein